MKHAREDYQRRFGHDPALDDPTLLSEGSTPIGEDEPVCLFRAQDRNFVLLLRGYESLLKHQGHDVVDREANRRIIESVNAHIGVASLWQQNNPDKVKAPDVPISYEMPMASSTEHLKAVVSLLGQAMMHIELAEGEGLGEIEMALLSVYQELRGKVGD